MTLGLAVKNFQNYSCFSDIFQPKSVQQTISGVHQNAFHICCLIIHPILHLHDPVWILFKQYSRNASDNSRWPWV